MSCEVSIPRDRFPTFTGFVLRMSILMYCKDRLLVEGLPTFTACIGFLFGMSLLICGFSSPREKIQIHYCIRLFDLSAVCILQLCGRQLDNHEQGKDNGPGTDGHQGRKPQVSSNGKNWEKKYLTLSETFPSLAYHFLLMWFKPLVLSLLVVQSRCSPDLSYCLLCDLDPPLTFPLLACC